MSRQLVVCRGVARSLLWETKRKSGMEVHSGYRSRAAMGVWRLCP